MTSEFCNMKLSMSIKDAFVFRTTDFFMDFKYLSFSIRKRISPREILRFYPFEIAAEINKLINFNIYLSIKRNGYVSCSFFDGKKCLIFSFRKSEDLKYVLQECWHKIYHSRKKCVDFNIKKEFLSTHTKNGFRDKKYWLITFFTEDSEKICCRFNNYCQPVFYKNIRYETLMACLRLP